ncbi:MAG: FKBP-type peptidyl-prolyl cis-trans isomerase [Prevotella sp.]|nr:FKBP-type peptidyl-prolyl cis-trans isomerase [Prevotella sp.]
MKKITFVAAMAIAAATLTSCGGAGTPSANLKTDIDSLSYAAGIALGTEFKDYNVLTEQFGVDSAYVNDFIKGLNEAASAGDDKKNTAYYAGIQVGSAIKSNILPNMTRQFLGDDSTKTLSKGDLLAAFVGTITGKETKMTKEQADSIQKIFQQAQQQIRMAKQKEENDRQKAEQWAKLDKENAEKFAANKAAGEKFLADNKSKEGVQTTASGLQYKVVKMGDGEKPTAFSFVSVNYEGHLIDGTKFDSSYDRNQPAQFGLNQVIAGWTEVLQLMPVGSEFEVYIPQELAYGPQEQDKIKPYSALIFKIELLDILQ